MSEFIKIDKASWKRTPYFNHYFNQIRCSYSITVNMDITQLKSKSKGCKLYPLLIHSLTTIVNRHDEFRTDIDSEGNIGIWRSLNPTYTVFNKQNETFCQLWSDYSPDINEFLKRYNFDSAHYSGNNELFAKPSSPPNTFTVSSIPWVTFTNFNLNIFADGSYLLPIFTFGKSFEEPNSNKLLIPLSIQVHHAVCDGFHVSRFIQELQVCLDNMF